MASLRQIRRRIRSVRNTKQITRAMQMVAAAKLKKLQRRLISSRPYAHKLDELLTHLAAASGQIQNPLFIKRDVKNIALVVIGGDKGLCGSYNVNILRSMEEFLRKYPKEKVQLVLVGKKAYEYFHRWGYPILYSITDLGGNLQMTRIQEIARMITQDFLNGTVDEVHLLFTHFQSAMRYQPTIIQFLPIENKERSAVSFQPSATTERRIPKAVSSSLEYIFEPNAKQIFEALLPRHLNTKVYISLAESFTSEQSSRMIAMKNATDAATDMIDSLTLVGNKLRQSQITKEIAEIVGGAEALIT